MARGANAKLRRRNRKKDEAAAEDRIFGTTEDLQDEDGNAHDFGVDGDELPLPPGMTSSSKEEVSSSAAEKEEPVVIKKKKKKKLTGKPCCDHDDDDDDDKPRMPSQKKQGIKTTPLILLILMTGTAILPALIYASDYLGSFMSPLSRDLDDADLVVSSMSMTFGAEPFVDARHVKPSAFAAILDTAWAWLEVPRP